MEQPCSSGGIVPSVILKCPRCWGTPHTGLVLYQTVPSMRRGLGPSQSQLCPSVRKRVSHIINAELKKETNEWKGEWMDRWMNGWTDRWMNEWIGGWVDGWMNEQMDEWMDGWVDKWVNEWRNARLKDSTSSCRLWACWGVGHLQMCGLEPDSSGLRNLYPVPALGGVFALLLFPQCS